MTDEQRIAAGERAVRDLAARYGYDWALSDELKRQIAVEVLVAAGAITKRG